MTCSTVPTAGWPRLRAAVTSGVTLHGVPIHAVDRGRVDPQDGVGVLTIEGPGVSAHGFVPGSWCTSVIKVELLRATAASNPPYLSMPLCPAETLGPDVTFLVIRPFPSQRPPDAMVSSTDLTGLPADVRVGRREILAYPWVRRSSAARPKRSKSSREKGSASIVFWTARAVLDALRTIQHQIAET